MFGDSECHAVPNANESPCAAKRVRGLKEAWQNKKNKLTFVFFLSLRGKKTRGKEPRKIQSRPG